MGGRSDPEARRAYQREYMRRQRLDIRQQWTEECLTEKWEDRKARLARERTQQKAGSGEPPASAFKREHP